MEIAVIRQLVARFAQSRLTELELSVDASLIRIARSPRQSGTAWQRQFGPPEEDRVGHVCVALTSPTVGTFIKCHPVTEKPFVNIGSQVTKGDVVALISYGNFVRAVEALEAGSVTDVLVENGQAVGFGQRLFVIERRSEA